MQKPIGKKETALTNVLQQFKNVTHKLSFKHQCLHKTTVLFDSFMHKAFYALSLFSSILLKIPLTAQNKSINYCLHAEQGRHCQ